MKRLSISTLLLAAVLLVSISACVAADLKPIKLPAPNMKGGMPLMEALKARRSVRNYTDQKISNQVLSDLLWAAFGVNRTDEGKRTAPSAMNWQEIDIYVTLEQGLYVYDPHKNTLEPVVAGDLRAQTGMQRTASLAAINLVYVADYTKISDKATEDLQEFYTAADCGFIGQNVYLFCASAGLGTVVRAYIDRESLADAMKLRSTQRIILAQSIGYPKDEEDKKPALMKE